MDLYLVPVGGGIERRITISTKGCKLNM